MLVLLWLLGVVCAHAIIESLSVPCMTKWTNKTLLADAHDVNTCSVVLAGATWDLHFKGFVGHGVWQRAAELFCKRNISSSFAIKVGFITYQDERLPMIS